ncbi:nucleotide exchange factor GrpE [Cytophagaceae bacterium ABcell3]|nr:nucleotide exchange factor GrpE [Cytophagaceae bacterium ABcell3]
MMNEQEENSSKHKESTEEEQEQAVNEAAEEQEAPSEEGQESAEEESVLDVLKRENAELKDKFLRLYSEFENFRRRTSKEKSDLIKSASEGVISSLLPVVDDFERAMKSMEEIDDNDPVKEGVILIHNKFYKILESKGLKPMNAQGQEFNSEIHEAITNIPAPSDDLKGKVVDEVEKGYYLNDKVIRFAKVVIGA